jgi:hypothetical protein
MVNNSKTELPLINSSARHRRIIGWITRYAAIEIAVLLSLAIAAFFLGRHLLDTSVPVDGDVRSHIFKLELLQSYLSHFSWPQWNPYWYHGIPEDQFYPPGFYFLGALLSFVMSGAIAYKVLLFFTLVLNGLAIYYFSRRVLKFDSHLAIWCLLAYETATPMLINFLYGEGPNLLGWSVTLIFLSIYLSQSFEQQTRKLFNIVLPGFLLGIALLIHPFPVIFAVMVVAIFHIIWLIRKRDLKTFARTQLPYLAGVFVIGGLISLYYWLPAFLTLHYSSPIYSFTRFQWPGGTIYLITIILLALASSVLTRYKLKDDLKLDVMIVSFIVASFLGFGGTNYLPFGLGSLVQEFRFATIIIPFFGILLIAYPLKYQLFRLNVSNMALAIGVGALITLVIFGLDRRGDIVTGFKQLSSPGLGNLYQLLTKQFAYNFATFAVTVFPYVAVILFLVFSLTRKTLEARKSQPTFVLAGGICLVLLISFVPYIYTEKQINLGRLYNSVDNYEQPGYAQIMSAAQAGRMIVPMSKGFLTEGDSPVTFGWHWGVQTVNGPYNQGDPKFFKFTVHLEWEERWLNYQWIRENLMQESAAKYIFIRGFSALPGDLNGIGTKISNQYGKLLELQQETSYAIQVKPILIDVAKPREVTEFFNILLPNGYKMVLVDIHDVKPGLIGRFDYVMVDEKSKVALYPNKTIFLLTDSTSPAITESQGIVNLTLPYLTFTKIFYHGDIADGYMWIGWDNWPGSRITPDQKSALFNFGPAMAQYIDKLGYTPAIYKMTSTWIDLTTSPGFTLVKDSYFPYWENENSQIMSTTQGFMLVYSDSSSLSLNYRRPLYYLLAAAFTALGLTGGAVTLILLTLVRRNRTKNGFLY